LDAANKSFASMLAQKSIEEVKHAHPLTVIIFIVQSIVIIIIIIIIIVVIISSSMKHLQVLT